MGQAATPEAPLFPAKVSASPEQPDSLQPVDARLLICIRRAEEELDMRAMRRGSLQAIAFSLGKRCLPRQQALELLKSFSGHKSDKTLLRYLSWGEKFETQRVEGAEAAIAGLLQLQH